MFPPGQGPELSRLTAGGNAERLPLRGGERLAGLGRSARNGGKRGKWALAFSTKTIHKKYGNTENTPRFGWFFALFRAFRAFSETFGIFDFKAPSQVI